MSGHFEKKPAPARPTAGAFATAHLIDMMHVSRNIVNLATAAQAPTRAGLAFFQILRVVQRFPKSKAMRPVTTNDPYPASVRPRRSDRSEA